MRFREVSIIDRLYRATDDFFHVSAIANPFCTQRWQTLFDVAGEVRITPRTAGVVNAHRLVYFDLAGHCFRWREIDLAKRNAHVWMNLAGDVNLARVVAGIGDSGFTVARFGITDPSDVDFGRNAHWCEGIAKSEMSRLR